MTKNLRILVIVLPLIAACTAVKVDPLPASEYSTPVCIVENEDVIVPNFLAVVRNGFDRHGIGTKVFNERSPESCDLILTYTALRSWDLKPYLSHAELWLRDQDGNRLGYAEYHLRGGGGFALNKWASVESKMDPVMDKLLAAYE